MRVSVLGSGSGGNATLVSSGRSTILIDAGFRVRELARRCRAAEVEPESISAIVISHEHSDHILGALDFSQKFGVPIFCSAGTARALDLDGSLFAHYIRLEPGREQRVGDLQIRPFATPHDANESLAFRIEDGRTSCALATDLGHFPASLEDLLAGVTALLFEFNHDEDLLRDGPYHWSLKKRIAGGLGHLSNRQSAEAVESGAWEGLAHVVALHLSRQNNEPALVRALISEALTRRECAASFGCADQTAGYETIEF